MSKLHIANTQFEWELTQKTVIPLQEGMAQSPIFRQLQFLPCLYAAPDDGVAVTSYPEKEYRNLHLLSSPNLHYTSVESWGASLSVAAWAQKHNIPYRMPPWEVVRTVNSKEFSFTEGKPLPNAALLYTLEEARAWLKSSNPKVLKTCFGVSGKGHLIIDASTPDDKILAFLKRQWQEDLPVLGEPWVKRVADFSTQWQILETREILYIGETLCFNDARGSYVRNRVGMNFPYPKHLEEHKAAAIPILRKMATMGYFGNVGIDAFIYETDTLHPIVEINARKTMGWATLMIQKRHFPDKSIYLSFVSSQAEGYLPTKLQDGSSFTRQLVIDTE